MSPLAISWVVFSLVFAAALVGMFLRAILPEPHLSDESMGVIKLGIGLIATMAALVLGLLIASAKSSYDTESGQINRMTANIILLDRLLAQYGKEAQPLRDALRKNIPSVVDRIWHENSSGTANAAPFEGLADAEAIYDGIRRLSPRDEAQRSLQERLMTIATELAQTRLLLFTQSDTSISMPFLATLVFWLMIIFGSFSLYARPNATIVAVMFICTLSASGAIFLVLELSQPFAGLMMIPREPLLKALPPLAT